VDNPVCKFSAQKLGYGFKQRSGTHYCLRIARPIYRVRQSTLIRRQATVAVFQCEGCENFKLEIFRCAIVVAYFLNGSVDASRKSFITGVV
jgi:hypothetical protein